MSEISSILVVDSNNLSRETLKVYLSELGLAEKTELYEDYLSCAERLKSLDENSVVIIDIGKKDLDNEALLSEIKLYTTKIIVTSLDYSTDMIIKAMRLGAKEFLPKPVIKDDLKQILTRFSVQEYDNNKASKIISIFSNKGGIGKTTIAINVAAELAKVTRDKVALIDLNMQLGDVSTFLNLDSTFDINYVIRNLLNSPKEVILQTFQKYKNSGLYVLADPSYIEQTKTISVSQIDKLLKVLQKTFSYIVIDMPASIDSNTLKILDESDKILFTTIVNIPAIRNAQRCMALFNSRNYSKNKVKIIVNRFMENDEIKPEDVENTLNESIYWKLPNNYFSIMEAINKGIIISEVNTNSNIAESFRGLATKLSDDIIEEALAGYKY